MEDVLHFVMSSIRLSIPLIFAALGGLMSERSGVANIALEAYLLFSAFAAAAATSLFANVYLGVIAAIIVSAIIGYIYAIVCVYGKGDQIVIGTAFNLLAAGIIPVLTKTFFGITGSTPSLEMSDRFTSPIYFFVIGICLVVVLDFVFRKTKHGLRIHASGENPHALLTQGVSFKKVRIWAIVEGSIIAGIGGIYLSVCQSSSYVRDMAAGRGFIALAALILGAWKPIPTFLACLFFSATDALQIQLQGQTLNGIQIPNSLIQVIPYLITLCILVFTKRAVLAPRAINK